jgi:hypothetical protein
MITEFKPTLRADQAVPWTEIGNGMITGEVLDIGIRMLFVMGSTTHVGNGSIRIDMPEDMRPQEDSGYCMLKDVSTGVLYHGFTINTANSIQPFFQLPLGMRAFSRLVPIELEPGDQLRLVV